jgi:hypothetical protein
MQKILLHLSFVVAQLLLALHPSEAFVQYSAPSTPSSITTHRFRTIPLRDASSDKDLHTVSPKKEVAGFYDNNNDYLLTMTKEDRETCREVTTSTEVIESLLTRVPSRHRPECHQVVGITRNVQ